MDLNKPSRFYEYRLAFIFFLTWGFVFLDRLTLSYLTPNMVNDLGLSNAQIGSINMWQTIGYALFAPVFAMISDRLGSRKRIIILAVLFTSIFSALTTLASSVSLLIPLRFLVGACEGVILPAAIPLVAAASSPGRFGRNVGIVYAGAAVIASTLGPIIVTQLAAITNWRMSFLLVSIPSFIITFLIWKLVHEVSTNAETENVKQQENVLNSFVELLKYRNIVVSILICIFAMGGLWIFLSFGPLYLTKEGHLSSQEMGFLMSGFGLIAILWQIIIPHSSDYIGRKPAMIIYSLLCVLTPLALYLSPSGAISKIVLVIFAGTIVSLTCLFLSIIPTESVPPRLFATSSALIMGIGELVGAFTIGFSGSLADTYGLPVVMLIAAVLYVVVAIISLTLKETIVRKVKSNKTDATISEPTIS